MKDLLEQKALHIIRRLNEHGFQAYLVGGCVRDKQLKRPVKDYDIATSAHPEEVQRLFERTIPTGLQHGTVTVLEGREPFEVTTFRREGGYEAFRRPTEVEYIDSLTEDLQRRDFTMNAMAIDAEGRSLDPFGGMGDLQAGVLRCVGEASERFREDALRMLRCIRFAAEYGLRVEEGTWNALRENIPLLRHIAMERVRAELERMIEGDRPGEAIRSLVSSQALRHTKSTLLLTCIEEQTGRTDWDGLQEADLRWTCLYLQLGVTRADAEEDLKKLTFPRWRIDRVGGMLGAHAFLWERIHNVPDTGAAAEARSPGSGTAA
ncbi:CCA tRNA nucleotidyltransferase [Paenibacillus sp. P25]|nr:CCA tRNA nucleotidyltransferase [Paenibacillus sp. P25]